MIALSADAVISGARGGSTLPNRTVVPAPGLLSTRNSSIRRCAPSRPRPMPVADLCDPASTAGRLAIPAPLSRTLMTNVCGALLEISPNSTCPPPPYSNALRAISETAVVIRVWSCASKPISSARRRVRLRTSTISVSAPIEISSRRGFMSPPSTPGASRPPRHHRARADGRATARRRSGWDVGWPGRDRRQGPSDR